MIVVGLTGGIGSGKSYISDIFKYLGIPVYNSDIEARNLTNENADVLKKIRTQFGESVFSNGTLNRPALAAVVFNNKAKLNELNAIIHPEVAKHFQLWCENQNSKYIIKETAILFETGIYKSCNYTILVTANEDIRIKRVMQRDKCTIEEVIQRMKSQMDDTEKRKLASFSIENNPESKILEEIIKIDYFLKNN